MEYIKREAWIGIAVLLLFCVSGNFALAQVTTAFTYQGELVHAGGLADGEFDFEFELFDDQIGGVSVVGATTVQNLQVDAGLFQTEVDFGMGAFGLMDVWLEVRVREGGSNGSFTTLTPRQKVTPAPLAQHAMNVEMGAIGGLQIADGSVGSADINSNQVQTRVSGNCSAGESIRQINANGSVVCEPDDVGSSTNFWSTTGNEPDSGAFLGTTNGEPFELRVDDQRVLRIVDGGGFNHAPNFIAGSDENVLDESGGSVSGATISGGGGDAASTDCGPDGASPCVNTVANDYATVVGGKGNYATGNVSTAMGSKTVASGSSSTALGRRTIASGSYSMAMGLGSSSSGSYSVAMGRDTMASGLYSAAMGYETEALGIASTAMGDNSVASGTQSTAMGHIAIASGTRSTAMGSSTDASGWSSTAMGQRTTASGFASTAMGSGTTALGTYATAMGFNTSAGGAMSLAAGRRATVRDFFASGEEDEGECSVADFFCGDEGTFVWADSEDADFISSGPNQFMVRASGGVAFGRQPDDYFEIQTPFGEVAGDGTGTSGAFRVRLNGATRLRLMGNGGLGVGSSFNTSGVPERGLRVHGVTRIGDLTTSASNDVCANADGVLGLCSSSQRFKQDVKDLNTGKQLIERLRPVTYRWIDSGDEAIGLVAEEVAAIEPRLVIHNADGEIQGVKYRQLSAVLVQAMQEQDARMQQQDTRMQAQATELQKLRQRLEVLEHEQIGRMAQMQQQLRRLQAVLPSSTGPNSGLAANSSRAER